jgi:hypothetical protein
MAATMATAMRMVLLVVFLVQMLNVMAASARPLKGDGGWLESGVGSVVVEMLAGLKSKGNPPTHCC